jgi:hypothetical protein
VREALVARAVKVATEVSAAAVVAVAPAALEVAAVRAAPAAREALVVSEAREATEEWAESVEAARWPRSAVGEVLWRCAVVQGLAVRA